jgi:hypothetical protein
MSTLRTSQRLKRRAIRFDNSPNNANKRPVKRAKKELVLVEESPELVVV